MIHQDSAEDGQLYWAVDKGTGKLAVISPFTLTWLENIRVVQTTDGDGNPPLSLYHILAPCIPPAEVMDMASTLRINAATEAK